MPKRIDWKSKKVKKSLAGKWTNIKSTHSREPWLQLEMTKKQKTERAAEMKRDKEEKGKKQNIVTEVWENRWGGI